MGETGGGKGSRSPPPLKKKSAPLPNVLPHICLNLLDQDAEALLTAAPMLQGCSKTKYF